MPTSPYLDLSVLSGNTIRAEFTPPLSDGGSSINSYKVDWDTDPGVHEVQMITTSTYIGANTIQSVTTSIPDVNERQIVAMTANAVRVPTPNGSLAIMHLNLNKKTDMDEVQSILKSSALHGDLVNQV